MSKAIPLEFADYTPVELRHRHDGWTPERQSDFLVALSQSACVEEACRAVGKSPGSAYALRRRIETGSFRAAWGSRSMVPSAGWGTLAPNPHGDREHV